MRDTSVKRAARDPLLEPVEGALELEILALDGATLILLAAVIEPLRAANRVLGRRAFGWRIVSPDGRAVRTTSGLEAPAEAAFTPEASRDPLIVVASYEWRRAATPELLGRLARAGRVRRMAIGVESGVWLLALAGLLAGGRATPHWEDVEEFQTRFPEIAARPERFLIEGARATSGGALPTLDLMLEIVRRRHGAPLALEVSRTFIYDAARSGEGGPTLSLAGLERRDKRVARAVARMQAHLEEPLGLEAIAAEVGVGPRRLRALFRRVLGVGPREHYLALRLGRARRLLIETNLMVGDIAYATGFGSAAAFARAYRASFGERPLQTRGALGAR